MSWRHVLTHWPTLLDRLAHDFPHLDVTILRGLRGNRAKIERYLAQTHDLTAREAAQTLDDWLARRSLGQTALHAA